MSSVRRYRVDGQRSRIVVRARSSIHDSHTTWDSMEGSFELDPNALECGVSGSFRVDMMSYDAGDWLKNRKLKKDFDLARYPTASFEVNQLRDIERAPDGRFSATAEGIVQWRGNQVAVTVAGQGTVTPIRVEARGSFELDVRKLGIEPPRFLVFKVENVVTVEISLWADAS